jgi:hypothetical protein
MRITEGQLRQIIREALLTEGAMTPEGALQAGIRFDVRKFPDSAVIRAFQSGQESAVGGLAAEVTANPCSGAWEIVSSRARIDGLGPLMYDLMIDLISPHPLMSDRAVVSKDAKRVWDHYLDRRVDIEKLQLDDRLNTLTPVDDDNCSQRSSEEWEGKGWPASSLSKAYRRKDGVPSTIDDLRRLGLIDLK